MEKRKSSLADIQEVPKESLILLSGPPGAGKSTFCHQVVLNSLAMDKPVVYVTTEHGPAEVIGLLKEKGLGEFPPGTLSFVDAFAETVGMKTPEQSDTLGASCEDLNSISMAIAKLQERINRRDILLSFDSLTSPYLFNKEELFRFMRLCLAKFASEGNSVLALMDEGCGKEEDLGALMSVADGIVRMDIGENSRIINVLKHPKVQPARTEIPVETKPTIKWTVRIEPVVMRQFIKSFLKGDKAAIREDIGDFVNLFWPNLAHWSGMLWDPKGFPKMIYELNKEDGANRENLVYFPWYYKLMMKLLMPKKLSQVRDMKKLVSRWPMAASERSGIMECLEDVSRKDEHYIRVYENSDCQGFDNIGASIASHIPPMFAGCCQAMEMGKRDWNAIETKCIGLGDPYCEFKVVPGEIDELNYSLEKDSLVVEKIHERLMEQLMAFLINEKSLVDRPRLGSDVHVHVACHAMGFPHLGARYRMAQRMGGARSGKIIGERLIEAGIKEDEAIKRVTYFMNYCKVGKVSIGETIRIRENCEPIRTKLFTHIKEPSCYFTTGFLNGLFSAVKNQHVREVKCIVAGDPYCQWEIY